jgi:uncharacterized membrane protein
MGSLQTAKILGGIGALLMLIGGLITATAGILSLIGFIMVFIAVKMIADEVKEKGIFDNFLYSFVTFIVAFVVLIAMALVVLASVGGIEFFTNLSNSAMTDPMEIFNTLQPVLFGAIAALLIFWVIAVIASLFYRKSFNLIAEKTGIKWFATAGLLVFIGTITTIILIGFIILLIAGIIEIIAFFSLPDKIGPKEAPKEAPKEEPEPKKE